MALLTTALALVLGVLAALGLERLGGRLRRVFTGLVLAALIVASAMLLPQRRVLGTAGFVVAAALGLYMVVSIFWNDRHVSKPSAR